LSLSVVRRGLREIFLPDKILDRDVEAQYDSWMKKRTFRPDLTDYLPYIAALTDKLNEESILKMSRTDAVKIAIELACKNVLPDVRVEKKRKLYQTLKM
jgi:hypothetical protein